MLAIGETRGVGVCWREGSLAYSSIWLARWRGWRFPREYRWWTDHFDTRRKVAQVLGKSCWAVGEVPQPQLILYAVLMAGQRINIIGCRIEFACCYQLLPLLVRELGFVQRAVDRRGDLEERGILLYTGIMSVWLPKCSAFFLDRRSLVCQSRRTEGCNIHRCLRISRIGNTRQQDDS